MFRGHPASIKKAAVIGFVGDAAGILVDIDCILETTLDIDVIWQLHRAREAGASLQLAQYFGVHYCSDRGSVVTAICDANASLHGLS